MNHSRMATPFAMISLTTWLALAACGGSPAASPSASPASSAPTSASAKPAASTSAAASASAGAAASGSAAAAASGSSDWNTVVAAGKKEGKVSLIGPPGDQVRTSLVDAFQKEYGISVDYNAMAGNQVTAKVAPERAAGQFNWDVLIAGSAGTL